MWESPINVMEIQDSFVSEIKEKTEEMVFTEIKRIGIDVNKEELIKALAYDRNQYEKGYKDGYAKAIDDFLKKICEKYTEEERNGNYTQYCCSIKQELADIAEQLKGGGSNAEDN